jgi:mRNA-degrading endonuclease toxin of MazEF toxin-antitoxin module
MGWHKEAIMIELTEPQLQALEQSASLPPRVVNPRTGETFVLLRADEYQRLKEDEYDDSPWTREELQALAWEAGKEAGWEDMDEYDDLPEKPWIAATSSWSASRTQAACAGKSGLRGKKRPAVIVQSDLYAGAVSTLVIAEVTKNLTMAGDPACLFIDANSPEGKATGLVRDSVVSCLLLVTVYADTVVRVLGTLSPTMKQKLNDCLKAALALTWDRVRLVEVTNSTNT